MGRHRQQSIVSKVFQEKGQPEEEMRAQTVKKGFPEAAALIRLTCPLRFTTTLLSSQPPSPHKTRRRALPLLSNLLRC